jgi:chitin synthase
MMEMDDMRSIYSSVKPASTILAGFPQQQHPYMAPPRSPAPFGMNKRVSTMTGLSQFRDQPVSVHGRNLSMMSLGSQARLKSPSPNPYQDNPRSPYQSVYGMPHSASRPSLLGMGSSRPTSMVMDFRTAPSAGPSDHDMVEAIRLVLSEVDLDTVTKKQVRALVEQRLQCEVPAGERRQFLDKAIDGELANM